MDISEGLDLLEPAYVEFLEPELVEEKGMLARFKDWLDKLDREAQEKVARIFRAALSAENPAVRIDQKQAVGELARMATLIEVYSIGTLKDEEESWLTDRLSQFSDFVAHGFDEDSLPA